MMAPMRAWAEAVGQDRLAGVRSGRDRRRPAAQAEGRADQRQPEGEEARPRPSLSLSASRDDCQTASRQSASMMPVATNQPWRAPGGIGRSSPCSFGRSSVLPNHSGLGMLCTTTDGGDGHEQAGRQGRVPVGRGARHRRGDGEADGRGRRQGGDRRRAGRGRHQARQGDRREPTSISTSPRRRAGRPPWTPRSRPTASSTCWSTMPASSSARASRMPRSTTGTSWSRST